jgi:hypothetical protein
MGRDHQHGPVLHLGLLLQKAIELIAGGGWVEAQRVGGG